MSKGSYLIPLPRRIVYKEGEVNLKNFSLSIKGDLEKIREEYKEKLSLTERANQRVFLEKVSTIKEEGYLVQINPKDIKIQANTEKGFFYCLKTLLELKEGDFLPCLEIEDFPSLGIRGFHLNFNGMRQIRFKEAEELIGTAAKLKLNTILIEYGDRFPFQKHPLIPCSNSLTQQEVVKLNEIAKENFMEVIPLHQSFAHQEFVLDHEEYSHLREGGKEKGRQLCPLNPGSFKLFTELAEEIIDLHPEGRFFHIGADETMHLGECPRCKKEAEKIGKGGLYVNYINKICNWIKKQGKTPILWDDMLCRYPETLSKLDKEAVIMYWEYWTTQEKSPIWAARAANKGILYDETKGWDNIVYDQRWNKEWKEELPDLEKKILEKFSTPLDLEKDLGEDYLFLFKDYLGKDFPKCVTSFPYLKFYQDKGFKVIGGPTTLGSVWVDKSYGLPNYNRFLANIKEFSRRCIKEKAEGIITTSFPNFPSEILYFGLLATAQFTWKELEK